MERLAGASVMPGMIADADALILFRNGGQGQHGPLVRLARHEAGEVVHVDALHDDDDPIRALVVEAREKGVGKPLVGRLALRLGEGVLRLQGIVDDDEVATAPGEWSADGGASLTPWRVVVTSPSLFLPDRRMPGKTSRYQGASTTARKALARWTESSWP